MCYQATRMSCPFACGSVLRTPIFLLDAHMMLDWELPHHQTSCNELHVAHFRFLALQMR